MSVAFHGWLGSHRTLTVGFRPTGTRAGPDPAGQTWSTPGRSPGCGLWSRNPAGQPRTQTGPGNADWAPSRFPVRSNWHYLPCENSDALRSIGGVTWRLSRGRPGDDCVRGRRQLSRGAQDVTHRHSVHRRVNVVRAGANCGERPICRLLFTVCAGTHHVHTPVNAVRCVTA